MQQRAPRKHRDGKTRDDCFEDGSSGYSERSIKECHIGGRPKVDGVSRADVAAMEHQI